MKEPRRKQARRSRSRRPPSHAKAGNNLAIHDLKNLAGRLAFLCKNLAQHYEDPLFKRTAIDALEDTVVHMKRLAADMREHEDRIVIKLKVDLNRLLSDAIREVRPDLVRRVEVREQHGDIPSIWGDSFLLRRAFACAIENALEAMEGSGSLALVTRLAGRGSRRTVHVDIQDSGPGMSAEFIKDRLGRPITSSKEEGLGLGVYTLKQVARIHEGDVTIRSAHGAGTHLSFRFPAISD